MCIEKKDEGHTISNAQQQSTLKNIGQHNIDLRNLLIDDRIRHIKQIINNKYEIIITIDENKYFKTRRGKES